MSQENVEFLETLFAGAADMEKQALLDALPNLIAQTCDPDIEWVEDPRRADRRVYRGHEGVRESWERWLENFDEQGVERHNHRETADRTSAKSMVVSCHSRDSFMCQPPRKAGASASSARPLAVA